jgi:uracil-DNA glycosylase
LPYWKDLESKSDCAYKSFIVYPTKDNIFKCFNYFDFKDTKVVILGQDPYPKPADANGLAFSVNRSNNLPSSLKNIFKELENDLKIKRVNGDLSD